MPHRPLRYIAVLFVVIEVQYVEARMLQPAPSLCLRGQILLVWFRSRLQSKQRAETVFHPVNKNQLGANTVRAYSLFRPQQRRGAGLSAQQSRAAELGAVWKVHGRLSLSLEAQRTLAQTVFPWPQLFRTSAQSHVKTTRPREWAIFLFIPLKTKLECPFGFAWWRPVWPVPHGSRILTEETPVNMQKHS